MRSILFGSVASAIYRHPTAADTAGGAAVADAPPAAAAGAGASAPADPASAAAPAGGGAPTKKRLPRGTSAQLFDSLELAKAAPKPADGFEIFRIVRPAKVAEALGKPAEVFCLTNHRNALQGTLLKVDGYSIAPAEPKREPLSPASRVSKADALLAEMDEATRQALFARYMANGNGAAAAALPAAPPRQDTATAEEFDGKTADNGKGGKTPAKGGKRH